MRVKIIADSCCDLPLRVARDANVQIVPLTVTFGSRHFTENVDIDSRLFFKLLTDGKSEHPKTSQPNPEAFIKAFRDAALDGYDEIVCVNVSSGLSGTFNSASIAAKIAFEDGDNRIKVHVFDTLNASAGVGELVLRAAKMAKYGKSGSEIIEYLTSVRTKVSLYCVLDTLEFVRRGGRIGNIRAVIGELLKIKPLITFFRGVPVDVAKVRGMVQAKNELIRLFKTRAASMEQVTIVHANAYERACDLGAELERTWQNIKISIYEVGAVIGSYSGPGALGLIFEEKEPRWSEG